MGNPVTLATPAVPATAPVAPIAPKPLAYTYSTGNAFSAFVKFDGKNYFMWGRNMVTQLRALGVRIVDRGGSSPAVLLPGAMSYSSRIGSRSRNGLSMEERKFDKVGRE